MSLLSLIYLLVLCGIASCLTGNELPTDFDLRPNADDGDKIVAAMEQELAEAMIKVISIEDDDDDVQDVNSLVDMENMISSLESEKSLEDLVPDGDATKKMNKRLTLDFMGMQVSYPQYLRLVKLQEKVVKLNQMIRSLHGRFTQEQLNGLPQYQRLMQLYASLMPLLPQPLRETQGMGANKRSPFSVDFLGLRVSYPQYLRLKLLQEKVIKLDKVMRHLQTVYPIELLEASPRWETLVSLHSSLKKLLPPEYLAEFVDAVATRIRRKRGSSVELVRVPHYIRLVKPQEKSPELDTIMRKLAEGWNRSELAESVEWLKLMALRQSLQILKPADYPTFDFINPEKRTVVMDFNGVQVSFPQYLHLMSLRKKALKLEAAMKKISDQSTPENLSKNPNWETLIELRQSLSKLLPVENHN